MEAPLNYSSYSYIKSGNNNKYGIILIIINMLKPVNKKEY